jgi:hypothetical protein
VWESLATLHSTAQLIISCSIRNAATASASALDAICDENFSMATATGIRKAMAYINQINPHCETFTEMKPLKSRESRSEIAEIQWGSIRGGCGSFASRKHSARHAEIGGFIGCNSSAFF